ncbi:MAG: TRAP transporter small permease [Gammaproteobacteria bacterium]|nr:TRAP transporter small permease [Gammaproteobacteria bacterium]
MRFLRAIESGLLVVLLGGMVGVAVWQFISRAFFDGGLHWGDAFVRVMVLWIAMLGAMVAARSDDHIRIDLFSRWFPERVNKVVQRLASLLTAAVLGLFAWYSYQFVRLEYEDGIIAFASVPAWICEAIMPVAAAVMCLRYLLHVIQPPERKAG